jgi:hypothetical protein
MLGWSQRRSQCSTCEVRDVKLPFRNALILIRSGMRLPRGTTDCFGNMDNLGAAAANT